MAAFAGEILGLILEECSSGLSAADFEAMAEGIRGRLETCRPAAGEAPVPEPVREGAGGC